jgi:hypothetical protein
MARCKVYEIQGPDPKRTARAERCTRDAAGDAVIDSQKYRVCKRHGGSRWRLFVEGGWLYAVNPNAAEKKRTAKKKR